MRLILSLLLCSASGADLFSEHLSDSAYAAIIVKDTATTKSSEVDFKVALNRFNFEDSLRQIYSLIGLAQYDLSFDVFKYAMTGYYALQEEGKLGDKNLLTIIDFTKSSSKKRFYTIDLNEYKVKYFTYTSHGKNTGDGMASKFSNRVNSNQSSLGFYVTGETYVGSKGFSLKLDGAESEYNSKIRERGVVIHEAEYVSEAWIKKYGRLGRSFGCPALSKELSKEVINAIKNRTAVFAYFTDETYLSTSPYLNLESLMRKWDEETIVAAMP